MDTTRTILLLLDLVYIGHHLVIAPTTTCSWLEDVAGVDHLYSPSLLTTTTLSLAMCLSHCSKDVASNATTYNSRLGTCSCLNSTTIVTSQNGNRLWMRVFPNRGLTTGGLSKAASSTSSRMLFKVITNNKRSYTEAEAYCGTLGARLAVLDTDQKLNYVTGMPDFPTTGVVFVGATDIETEGVFLWSTGTPMTANHW